MEITKREIIASITIIAIMMVFGVLISGKISEAYMDAQEKYNKATKIENPDIFKYGMDTNIGTAFVYGEFKAVDTVTFPEIGGGYLSIEKVKERYTMHTRTVTSTSNGKTTSRTEVYWTWDRVGSEELKAKTVTFCGVKFEYSQFSQLSNEYIDTIKESSDVRYKYYSHPPESKGTIFSYLGNSNLGEDGAEYYEGKTIDETVDGLDNKIGVYMFWVFWVILTGAATYGFYSLDNKWLESYSSRK